MTKFYCLISLFIFLFTSCSWNTSSSIQFNKDNAFDHLEKQVSFGPRIPGSKSHENTVNYISETLTTYGWNVEFQEFNTQGNRGKNIIGRQGEGLPWVILGAHYDSRVLSDRELDPSKMLTPVPGANDGASGVAVLLELARILPPILEKNLQQNAEFSKGSIQQVWLVFFDLEDNGDIPGYDDWILGSTEFVKYLEGTPNAVIIVDMVGDANLKIYMESNSDQKLSTEIWDQAKELGYSEQFIPQTKYSIIDDHTPFLEKGIRAIDIIDFEYPYWHTTQDTPDKVSSQSLSIVGETLMNWITKKRYNQ